MHSSLTLLINHYVNSGACRKITLGTLNAGAYHCWATIVRLWALRDSIDGLKILGVHFGEAGKGKDLCDKLFSHVREHQRRCLLEKYDADTPERFATNICRNGGINNTTVLLGSVENVHEGEKKSLKSAIPDISKCHEFLFDKDGIWVKILPGFGKGKFYAIDKKMVDNEKIPRFDYEIVSKENLDEDVQIKSKPADNRYHENSNKAIQEFGIAKADTELNDSKDKEKTASNEDKVFFCENPVCRKPFFYRGNKLNHEKNSENCSVRVKKQSSTDFAKEYYISKNGISSEYQSKSYKETRGIVFRKGMLPVIDDIFLDLIRNGPANCRENIYEGHALPPKRQKVEFPAHVTAYLRKLFLYGEKVPSERRKPAQVAKEMKLKREFERKDWLSEAQIQGYFKRQSAKKRFGLAVNEEPSQAQIDDTENVCISRDHSELTMRIRDQLAKGEASDDPCPIWSENIPLCVIVQSIKASKNLAASKIEDYSTKELKKALTSLKIDDYDGKKATKKNIAKIMTQYVQEKCHCSVI